MTTEVRRLHPLSWLFMTASSIKGLILPAIVVFFASASNPLARYELLSLLFVGPAFVYALLKQGIYKYRFTDDELVIREGIIIKKERHIPYDRVHNIAMVRNPFHRMIGAASARVETAAGGEPEAVMRVLSVAAVEELRRYTLGKERAAALAGKERGVVSVGPAGSGAEALSPGEAAAGAEADEPAAVSPAGVLLHVPAGELARLGLISNRGFVVVAAFIGLMSQWQWWEQDWQSYYGAARERAPRWIETLLAPGSLSSRILLGVGLVILFVALLRLFSVAWYLVKYYGFTLDREDEDLRTEYGLLTNVSSLIPVHRIQLLTVSASLLHRLFGRAGIDLETAGVQQEGGGDLSEGLAASGIKTNRQWLAPIIGRKAAHELVRRVMPRIDIDAVQWTPIDSRAVRRMTKKALAFVGLPTAAIMLAFAFTPVPLSPWHGLWLPLVLLPPAYLGIRAWVRNAAWALTDDAVFFRSGWLEHKVSFVRFDKMQTVRMSESPFDRRHRMASVAVDTAGAGSMGHRVDIPYLDAEVARGIFTRLYAETVATEFRW